MWKREMLGLCFERDNHFMLKLDNFTNYIYVKLITTVVNKNYGKMLVLFTTMYGTSCGNRYFNFNIFIKV